MRKQRSFTLIELLVVIVIIGILAGVIIVSTSSSISKANFAKAQAFSNTVQQELLLNLVSEWTFDEDPAGIAKDTWGNNDGTLVGANGLPQIQLKGNCVYGTCYSFDGTDDYINFGNNNSLWSVDLTISAWINPKLLAVKAIVGKAADSGYARDYTFYISPGGKLNVWFGYDSLHYFNHSSTDSINLNKWDHVSFTRNENVVNFYINGALSGSYEYDFTPTNKNYPLYIGSLSTSNQYFFNGLIDDVRIYNAALSTSQIKQEYIAGLNSLLANGNISKEEYDQRLNNLAQK